MQRLWKKEKDCKSFIFGANFKIKSSGKDENCKKS